MEILNEYRLMEIFSKKKSDPIWEKVENMQYLINPCVHY